MLQPYLNEDCTIVYARVGRSRDGRDKYVKIASFELFDSLSDDDKASLFIAMVREHFNPSSRRVH